MQSDMRRPAGRADSELLALRARVAGAALVGLGVLAFWLLKDYGAW